VQRLVDHLELRRPVTEDQCGVDLAGVAGAELVLQVCQCAALLGQQQHAGGFFVEPVHELEESQARPRPAQLLDHAKGNPTAAMHRHPRGFGDREQVIVFEQDRELPRRRRGIAARGGHAHRRHPDFVAFADPRVGGGAALVQAHFAGADDPVDMRLRHALQHPQQVVVQALAAGFGIHRQPLHRRRETGRFARYTAAFQFAP
jgi:hypothetical protein